MILYWKRSTSTSQKIVSLLLITRFILLVSEVPPLPSFRPQRTCPDFFLSCGHIFSCCFLGYLQGSPHILLSIAKHDRQSPVPARSKKQKHSRTSSTTKPQTQWFCVQHTKCFHFPLTTNPEGLNQTNKNNNKCWLKEVRLFFWWAMGCEKAHSGIDKHLFICFYLRGMNELR